MQTMDTSSPILSVGALNRAIAQSLTEGFDTVLVSGEISNFKAYDSGHWYFSLKDEEGQIRCVMFRGKNAQLGYRPLAELDLCAIKSSHPKLVLT